VYVLDKRTGRVTIGEGAGESNDKFEIIKPTFDLSIQPIEASLYVTTQCNLNCNYCYIIHYYRGIPKSEVKVLTVEDWEHVIDQLYKSGIRILNFIGGDPLLYKDLPRLINYAVKRGFMGIELSTNGTISVLRIGKEAISLLKNLNDNGFDVIINVSLDSPDKKANDENRGRFDEVIAGLRQLTKDGFFISLASVISKKNYADIPKLVALANELKIKHIQLNSLIPVNPSQKYDTIVDQSTLSDVSKIIQELQQEYASRIQIINRLVPSPTINMETFKKYKENEVVYNSSLVGCGATTREVYIAPDGKLIPCPLFMSLPEKYSKASLKDTSFREVWQNDPAINEFREYLIKPVLSDACASCEISKLCRGGCRAMSYFLDADIKTKDPRCNYA
jgi:radical SAM protein with 4Fe4S-binding SPASM domain